MQEIEHQQEIKRKKSERILKWISLILLVVAIVVGASIWIMVSGVPAGYSPMSLTLQERKDAATNFAARVLEFGNQAQLDQPYDWSVSQDDINRWLASIPEIIARCPVGNPKKIYDALDSADLTDPVVSLNKGVITIMVRMRSRGKIVSLDLKTEMTPEKKLRVQMVGARVGKVPVPLSAVRSRVEKLKQKLASYDIKSSLATSGEATAGNESPENGIGAAMSTLITAIDEEPISTEFRWPLEKNKKKSVMIDDLTIDNKTLTLHVIPANH